MPSVAFHLEPPYGMIKKQEFTKKNKQNHGDPPERWQRSLVVSSQSKERMETCVTRGDQNLSTAQSSAVLRAFRPRNTGVEANALQANRANVTVEFGRLWIHPNSTLTPERQHAPITPVLLSKPLFSVRTNSQNRWVTTAFMFLHESYEWVISPQLAWCLQVFWRCFQLNLSAATDL